MAIEGGMYDNGAVRRGHTLNFVAVLVAALASGSAYAQENQEAGEPGRLQAEVPLEDEAARHLFEVASAHYRSGRFLDAAHEFEEAYRLSPRPPLLFNAYVAYRDADRREDERRTLRAYLEAEPDAANRELLVARLATLDRNATQAPASAPPASSEVSAPSADRPAPGFDPWPAILLSTGGAFVAAAIATGVAAFVIHSDLESVCTDGVCDPSRQGDIDAMNGLTVATDVLGGVGIIAAAVGVILLVTGASSNTTASLSPFVCDRRGCAIRSAF